MFRDVVVVGSGVSGLSCAFELARAGLSVEVVARSVPPSTTSNVAAAFWYPYFAFPRRRVLSWAARSWQRFAALASDRTSGVRMAQALEVVRDSPPTKPWWHDAAAEVGPAPADWLPPGVEAGWRFVAPVVDTRRYLPWLVAAVADLGVRTVRCEVKGLAALGERAPIVVDCAGLGAQTLVPDATVQAVRGQIVLVQNPGLSRVVVDEHDPATVTYIVPRGDDCVLGGTTDPGDSDRRTRPSDRDAVLARCVALEPRLANVRILADVVGLRPGRECVRLEVEHTSDNGTTVLHNYGHGGAGVTLSWGCAEEIAQLVTQCRRGPPVPRAAPEPNAPGRTQ